MPHSLPYWRLSSFYFWYYAALGAFVPFFPRWLQDIGQPAFAVSLLLGAWYATRIVGPPLWGWLYARSPQPVRWLRAGCWATALCFCGYFAARRLDALLATMLLFGLFYNAVMPQFEALTLGRLGARIADYGRIRLWGSVGFIVVVIGFGWLLQRFGTQILPALILPLLLALALGSHANSYARVPSDDGRHTPPLRLVLAQPAVLAFLVVALLMQLGFGAYYVYFSLHLKAAGHGDGMIGLLWAAGVLAEVVLFVFVPTVLRRVDAALVLTVCLAVTALRWTLTALFPESLPVLVPVQLLHALSFGAFHAACMQLIARHFPARMAGHGQSLLYGFSSGIGGVLGALFAGFAWQLGGGSWAFLGSAGVCVLALGIARLWLHARTPQDPG